MTVMFWSVVLGGAGGAMAPSDNQISTKRDRLCPPNNTGTPGFSDLPTALIYKILKHKFIKF